MNQKNNWDDSACVCIQVKVWVKGSLNQLEGGAMVRGHNRVEEQALEGNSPKWWHAVRQGCKGETALFWSEEVEPWDCTDLFCFRRLSPFFKPVQKGFPDFKHILQTPSV